ncbi:unnamed protein product, partial [Mesorhabditis spiculigera]
MSRPITRNARPATFHHTQNHVHRAPLLAQASRILENASFSEDGKGQLKTLLTSRPPCKTRAMNPVGQLVLCVFGFAVSLAICVWLAFFSGEGYFWKRMVFASGAAVCCLMFALLAYTSKKRIDHPQEPEPLPDLSQDRRRSTIGGRSSKRSIAHSASGDHHSASAQPTQVLVVQNKE